MKIAELKKRPDINQSKKLNSRFANFEILIKELNKKEINDEIVDVINRDVAGINAFSGANKELLKLLRKSQMGILKLIEKELKLVPKNLYRNRWLAIGMAAFGVPFGLAFSASLGNMAFLGVGIPIGMVVGMAIGAGMDKKASEEGRQLDLEAI